MGYSLQKRILSTSQCLLRLMKLSFQNTWLNVVYIVDDNICTGNAAANYISLPLPGFFSHRFSFFIERVMKKHIALINLATSVIQKVKNRGITPKPFRICHSRSKAKTATGNFSQFIC